jgi:hypothetical protein
MKTIIGIVAFSTVAAATAYAQPTEHARAGLYQDRQPIVQMYGAEHYQRRSYQQDVNPDFQLGGNRS